MDDLGKLLRDAGSGDRSAFEEVVRSQLGRLYGIAFRLTADRGVAEDVVQEVFLRILENRVPRETGSGAASWLARLAARRSIDVLREMSARRRREEKYAMMRDSERRGEAPLGSLDRSEEIAALNTCLAALPAETRACVYLHYAEGFGVREVAACLGRGKSSTAERIRTGLEKLRQDLGKRGLLLGAAPIADLLHGLPRPSVPEGLGEKIEALRSGEALVGSRGPSGPLAWILGVGVATMRVKPLILFVVAGAILATAGWGIAWKLSRPAMPRGGPKRAVVDAGPSAGHQARNEAGQRPESRSPADKTPAPPAAARDPGTLHGRVLDLEEKPIAGARVKVVKALRSRDPIETISGDDGSFEFAALAPDEYIVSVEDWCQFSYPSVSVNIPTNEVVILHVRPAAGVAVTVLAEGRGLLREEKVEVYSPRDGNQEGQAKVLMTDAQGRLYLGPFIMNQELGEHRFAFQAGTFPPEFASASIAKESKSLIEVILKPGATVTATGTLRNLQGEAIPGIEIFWRGPDGSPAVSLWCTTDEEGRFRRQGLSPGLNRVNVLGRFFNPQGESIQVVLGDAPDQEVPLTLDCISVVTLRIEDADGKPIPDAPVMMQGTFKSSMGRRTSSGGLRTKEDGTASLTAVPHEIELELTVDDPKLGFGKLKANLSAMEETLVMRVNPMLLIEGVVVDGAGDPVPGATITLTTPRPMIKFFHGSCDAAGKFSMKAAPGPCRLDASGGRRGAGAIDMVVGGETPSASLRVMVALKDILLVHITDPDGKPAPNVEVRSESHGRNGSWHKILTDARRLGGALVGGRAVDHHHLP